MGFARLSLRALSENVAGRQAFPRPPELPGAFENRVRCKQEVRRARFEGASVGGLVSVGVFLRVTEDTVSVEPWATERQILAIASVAWPGDLERLNLRDIFHSRGKRSREVRVVDQDFVDGFSRSEPDHDIAERKKLESALYESDTRLRWLASIVESSHDAIVSKNLDGIILSWNKGAEYVFGYTADEAIGQPITIVIPQDRQNEERDILTRIRRGEHVDHFETIRQRKDGHLIHISLTVSPVKDINGNIIGASKVARDITPSKRDQERIAALAREAEHRSRNVLATVQAAVKLSRADTVEGLKDAISGRVHAIANVHSLFAESRWIGADLLTIAKQELAPYLERGGCKIQILGEPVLLEPNSAQTLAVTLHELATNAAKYGSLSASDGTICLHWKYTTEGAVYLLWKEEGGPTVQMPTRRGFGSRIIEQMIAQLNGETHFEWRPEGLVCTINFPR